MMKLAIEALAKRALEGNSVTEHTVGDFVHVWTEGRLPDHVNHAVAAKVIERMAELSEEAEGRAEAEMDMQEARARGEYEEEDDLSSGQREYFDRMDMGRDPESGEWRGFC